MRPFIGIGPGRCGTETLVRFIRACGYRVTHEGYNSKWYAQDQPIVDLAKAMSQRMLEGEVNCRMFPHLGYLKKELKGLQIVCLHRPKGAVVDSYLRNIKPMFRPADRLRNYKNSEWPSRYPMIDAATAKQSIGFWWEMCEAFMDSPKFFHVDLESGFTEDAHVNRLYEFLEIPEDRRVIPEKRIYNTTEERKAMTVEQHREKTMEMTCV